MPLMPIVERPARRGLPALERGILGDGVEGHRYRARALVEAASAANRDEPIPMSTLRRWPPPVSVHAFAHHVGQTAQRVGLGLEVGEERVGVHRGPSVVGQGNKERIARSGTLTHDGR